MDNTINLHVENYDYRWYMNGKPIKGEANSLIDTGTKKLTIERVSNLSNRSSKITNYFNFRRLTKGQQFEMKYMNIETNETMYALTVKFDQVVPKEIRPFHIVILVFNILKTTT